MPGRTINTSMKKKKLTKYRYRNVPSSRSSSRVFHVDMELNRRCSGSKWLKEAVNSRQYSRSSKKRA